MTISLKLKPILLISMCRLIINIPIILSILYQYHDIILCNPSYKSISLYHTIPQIYPQFFLASEVPQSEKVIDVDTSPGSLGKQRGGKSLMFMMNSCWLLYELQGLVNVLIEHHPTIGDIITNKYVFKWCSKSPKQDIYQPLQNLTSLFHSFLAPVAH